MSELIRLKIRDVDFDRRQLRIVSGKGKKDRIVPFPKSFRETLALHVSNANKNKQFALFESSWKKPYSDRGIRKMLGKYSKLAGMSQTISPHTKRG